MIECVLGLLIGWFAGRPLFLAAGAVGGDVAALVFLTLLDELCAVVADKRHSIFRSAAVKAAFVILVLWIGNRTGTPLVVFAQLILLASIFRRTVSRAGRGENAPV
jgi:hypothetical protein